MQSKIRLYYGLYEKYIILSDLSLKGFVFYDFKDKYLKTNFERQWKDKWGDKLFIYKVLVGRGQQILEQTSAI